MQAFKYAATAWNDIKNSPGWLGKIALLALLQAIPVFGQIVLFGYLYGWARDIAWGVHAPMPAKIFGNEDGKLYMRGFYILVILFVFSLVPGLFSTISSALVGGSMGLAVGSDGHPSGIFALFGFGGVFGILSFLLSFAVLVAFNIGAMRTAIYDRIGAGFQLKKIWAMFRYDTNGALRILGMEILVALVGGLVISLVALVVFAIAGLSLVPAAMYLDEMSNPGFGDVLGALGPGLGLFTLFALAVGFVGFMFSVLVYAMVARASGYWTQQFQVAQWRGQDDPMPFEAAQAAQAAQQAQYAAQVQYAQAQADYAHAQAQQLNYQHEKAQQAYAQAQAAQAQASQAQASQAQAAQMQGSQAQAAQNQPGDADSAEPPVQN